MKNSYANTALAVLLLLACRTTAQSELTLYNMPFVPKISTINPAIAPWTGGYFGLPVISHVNVSAGIDFATFAELGLMFTPLQGNVTVEEDLDLIDRLLEISGTKNTLLSSNTIDLFSAGGRLKRGFISFVVTEQVEASFSFPRDMIQLLNDLQTDINDPAALQELVGRVYDLSALGITGTHYRTFNLSYAYDLSPKVSLGIRLGYVRGLGNTFMERQDFKVQVTNSGFESMGELRARNAGLQFVYDEEQENNITDYLRMGGNSGVVIGLGGQYRVSSKLDVAASINNIGGINWKNNVGQATLTEKFTEEQPDLEEYAASLFEVDAGAAAPYRTTLPTRLSVQANYQVLPLLSVSGLVYSSFANGSSSTSFSLAGNLRIGKFFGLTTALHQIQNKLNLGLGTSLNLGSLQLYMASDNMPNLLLGSDGNRVQFTGGVFFTFKRKSRTEHLARLQALDPEATTELIAAAPVTPTPEEQPQPENKAALFSSNKAKPQSVATPTTKITVPVQLLEDERASPVELASKPVKLQQLEAFKTPAQPPVQAAIEPQTTTPAIQLVAGTTIFLELKNRGVLYERASTQSPVLRIMQAGTKVKLREQPSDKWWKVSWGAKTGYLQADLLQVAGDQYNGLNVPNTPTTRQETEAAPQTTIPPTSEPKPPVVNTDNPLGSFFVTQATSFRRAATSSSGVIVRFHKGDKVEVLEKTNRYWWKVTFQGDTGWVKAALLEPF